MHASGWHIEEHLEEHQGAFRVRWEIRESDRHIASCYSRDQAEHLAAWLDLYQALEALELAARIDCPRTEAWANLLATCQEALRKAGKE